ncbi:MAG: SprB repeat-containing protein, partial [Bacteroidota bacterium]
MAQPLAAHVEFVLDASCRMTNGAVFARAEGGTAPYRYAWSNGDTLDDARNLRAGTYTLTVTDARGRHDVVHATVQHANTFEVNVKAREAISCNGARDGAISVLAMGGVAPYRYRWSNGSDSHAIKGLAAGRYAVTITDQAGCSATHAELFNDPEPLRLTIEKVVNVRERAADGAIFTRASGGTGPLQYRWSSGDTTQHRMGAPVGLHALTVVDANGCEASTKALITRSEEVVTSLKVHDVTCLKRPNGKVELQPQGGQAPYQFAWSHGPTTGRVKDLAQGNYTYTVTDANGHRDVDSVRIAYSSRFTASLAPLQWFHREVQATDDADGQDASRTVRKEMVDLELCSYALTIQDKEGCQRMDTLRMVHPRQEKAWKAIFGQLDPDLLLLPAHQQAAFQVSGVEQPTVLTMFLVQGYRLYRLDRTSR